MRACALAIILGTCAAASLAAAAAPQAPAAFDVHVLRLGLASTRYLPELEIVAAKRISADGGPGEREVRIAVGEKTFRVAFDKGSGATHVTRYVDRGHYGSPPDQLTLDLTDPWRWGRRPRHGTTIQGALLCEPVADPSQPFKPLDVRGFLQRLVPLLFAREEAVSSTVSIGGVSMISYEDWNSPFRNAARVLGSAPLREYLEPDQVERILRGAKETRRGVQATNFLRPVVALAHRETLEQLAKGASRGDAVADDALVLPPISRGVEDAVVVAYASSTDPEIRGLAGWVAAGTRDVGIYESLMDDVRAGRAILPGDASQREARFAHLEHVRAWQSITPPLLTLGASVAAIAAVMLLLRAATRRLL